MSNRIVGPNRGVRGMVVVWTFVAATSSYGGERRYEILDLGTLGGEISVAQAINEKGQVVGTSETEEGERHAFIWDATRGMKAIPGMTLGESRATEINNRGQVVGYEIEPRPQEALDSPPPQSPRHQPFRARIVPVPKGFVWSESEGRLELAHLSFAGCGPISISNGGRILGALSNKYGENTTAFWSSPSEVREVGEQVPGAFVISGMNSRGVFAAVARIDSPTASLLGRPSIGVLCNGSRTEYLRETKNLKGLRIRDLNEREEVLGRYTKKNLDQPFIWSATRGLVELESSGSLYLEPERMNNRGYVLGQAETCPLFERLENLGIEWRWVLDLTNRMEGDPETFPVVWIDGKLYSLNDYLPGGTDWDSLVMANGLNDHGWIVGEGRRKGKARAFLLKPVSE